MRIILMVLTMLLPWQAFAEVKDLRDVIRGNTDSCERYTQSLEALYTNINSLVRAYGGTLHYVTDDKLFSLTRGIKSKNFQITVFCPENGEARFTFEDVERGIKYDTVTQVWQSYNTIRRTLGPED